MVYVKVQPYKRIINGKEVWVRSHYRNVNKREYAVIGRQKDFLGNSESALLQNINTGELIIAKNIDDGSWGSGDYYNDAKQIDKRLLRMYGVK